MSTTHKCHNNLLAKLLVYIKFNPLFLTKFCYFRFDYEVGGRGGDVVYPLNESVSFPPSKYHVGKQFILNNNIAPGCPSLKV